MPKQNRGPRQRSDRGGMSWSKTIHDDIRLIWDHYDYTTMKVYQYMLMHHDTKSGRIHSTTYAKIADYIGICSRGVARGVANLVQAGLFEPSPKADVAGALVTVAEQIELAKQHRSAQSNSSERGLEKKRAKSSAKPPPSAPRRSERRNPVALPPSKSRSERRKAQQQKEATYPRAKSPVLPLAEVMKQSIDPHTLEKLELKE